jgi:hypothetical protein
LLGLLLGAPVTLLVVVILLVVIMLVVVVRGYYVRPCWGRADVLIGVLLGTFMYS